MRYLASWNSIWKLCFYEHLVMLPPTHKCQTQDPPCPFGQDLPLLLQHVNQEEFKAFPPSKQVRNCRLLRKKRFVSHYFIFTFWSEGTILYLLIH